MAQSDLRPDRLHVHSAGATRADRRWWVPVSSFDAVVGHAVAAPAGRAPRGSAGRLGPITFGPNAARLG
jgi:hypothetical protein